jgi:hypothetical protein
MKIQMINRKYKFPFNLYTPIVFQKEYNGKYITGDIITVYILIEDAHYEYLPSRWYYLILKGAEKYFIIRYLSTRRRQQRWKPLYTEDVFASYIDAKTYMDDIINNWKDNNIYSLIDIIHVKEV